MNNPLDDPNRETEKIHQSGHHEINVHRAEFDALRNGRSLLIVSDEEGKYRPGDDVSITQAKQDVEDAISVGRLLERRITDILKDHPGLASGYVALSLDR